MHRINLPARFFAKVRFGTGCWLWIGAKDGRGYGILHITNTRKGIRKVVRTHRIAWELFKGGIPAGKQVLHKCDNPACVKIDHLFLGTHDDNMKDMASKGRARNGKLTVRGENHPGAYLTRDLVEQARFEHNLGKSVAQIAREQGVRYGTLWAAVTKVSWQ